MLLTGLFQRKIPSYIVLVMTAIAIVIAIVTPLEFTNHLHSKICFHKTYMKN